MSAPPISLCGVQTVTAAGAADLIAHVWYRLGYRPVDSVVLVGLTDSPTGRTRCGAVLRIDIPPRAHWGAELDHLVRILARTGHERVVALIASGPDGARGGNGSAVRRTRGATSGPSGALPHRQLARAIRSAGRRGGLPVVDVIGVDAKRYRSYWCQDVRCCPPAGHSVRQALASSVAVAHVVQGDCLVAGEQDLVADVHPDPDSPLAELLGIRAMPTPADGLELWAQLCGRGTPIGAAELADLCLALDDALFRDALLAAVAAPQGPDGLDLARAVLDGRAAEVFAALDAHRPEQATIETARSLIAAVARQAPPGRRAEALAVLGWVEWWRGNGVAARLYTELAEQDVPGHRLADLVRAVLAAMVPPAWVEQKSSEALAELGRADR